jgi:TatD DNase family protein
VLIDSHCHLFMPEFDPDRAQTLSRARAAGVTNLLVIGYDLASSREAVILADREDGVSACVAIHPHHAVDATSEALDDLRELASRSSKVVGIGETGLDFYRTRSPREAQAAAFRAHLELARALRLPVVIHDREAHAETMRILAEDAEEIPAVVLHCFSGDRAMATEAWARGYYTTAGGPITYPNADGLRKIFRDAPRDRVLLETDAPYLPPTPHRGRRNEPAYLPLIADRLAELWGADPEAIAQTTAANTCRAFRLPCREERG